MQIFEIKNSFQTIRLLDLGATIYEWLSFYNQESVMLNNDDLNVYYNSKAGYFGGTIGRVANRIRNASFELNHQQYQLSANYLSKHNLHGGPEGFNTKTFKVVAHTDTLITFEYSSPHMEMGFPGDLLLRITYELIDNQMIISYHATTNQDTLCNITNHGHFILGGQTILDHTLQADFKGYLECDEELIPTGKIMPVANTPLDFSKEKVLKEAVLSDYVSKTKGIDHAFLFKDEKKLILKYQNRQLQIETSYPGLQIYSVNRKFEQLRKGKTDIPLHGGIAFECQLEPDAIHHPHFNSVVLKQGQTYQHFIKYTFTENQ